MRPVQLGDRVQVHYVKRLQDGSLATSRDRSPVELTVGSDHPRLPGLGSALLGMLPGASVTVSVSPEHAYGAYDARRVRHWSRTRFPEDQALPVGKWVRVLDRRGRRRAVRILEVKGGTVVVDTNHRFAGQTLELEVELLRVQAVAADRGELVPGGQLTDATPADPGTRRPPPEPFPGRGGHIPVPGRPTIRRDRSAPEDPLRDLGGEA
jgi:FKBP-type peptidyl-prolyl cis-trans isomerase 2